MEYILLAILFYAILFNAGTLVLITALNRQKTTDRPQKSATITATVKTTIAEPCEICEYHDCQTCADYKPEAIEPIPEVISEIIQNVVIDTVINKVEVSDMLRTYTDKPTDGLTEIEAQLLLDYFKFKETVNQIKTNHAELIDQFDLDELKKKTRKVKSIELPVTPDDYWMADNFPWLRTGKNKLGGGTCRLSATSIKPATIARMDDWYNSQNPPVEREMLLSTCPDCAGHMRTEFKRTTILEQDEEDHKRKIRKMVTVYTCDKCGKTDADSGSCGKYLKSAQVELLPLSESEINELEAIPVY